MAKLSSRTKVRCGAILIATLIPIAAVIVGWKFGLLDYASKSLAILSFIAAAVLTYKNWYDQRHETEANDKTSFVKDHFTTPFFTLIAFGYLMLSVLIS